LVLLGLAVYLFYLWKNNVPILGQVLVLAGGISNYWDRVFYGGVIDFIILKAGHLSWPAFNIADAIVLLGFGIMIIAACKKA
jgi:signal peptidase II